MLGVVARDGFLRSGTMAPVGRKQEVYEAMGLNIRKKTPAQFEANRAKRKSYRKPVSDANRIRKKSQKHCSGCGSKTHNASTCPKVIHKPKAPKRGRGRKHAVSKNKGTTEAQRPDWSQCYEGAVKPRVRNKMHKDDVTPMIGGTTQTLRDLGILHDWAGQTCPECKKGTLTLMQKNEHHAACYRCGAKPCGKRISEWRWSLFDAFGSGEPRLPCTGKGNSGATEALVPLAFMSATGTVEEGTAGQLCNGGYNHKQASSVYGLVNRLAASAALREQEGYTFDNVAEADVKGFGRRAATADEAKAWNRAHPGVAAKHCKEHPGQELQLVAHHRVWGITQRGTRKLFLVPLPHKVVKKGDAYPGESWEEVRPGVQRLRACAKGTVFCTDGAKAYAQGKTKKATKKMPKGIKHETVDHYNNQYVRFAKVHFNEAHAISKKRKVQVGTQKIEIT